MEPPPFGNQFQTQNQQQQAAPRRARSAGANNNSALGSNALNQFATRNNNIDGGADNRVASDKNRYILVDARGNRLGSEYKSKTAYGAASKAARNHSDIYLWDRNHPASEGGRVYSYAGRMKPITNPSAHTQKYGITMEPEVKSRGFVDLDRNGEVIQS